MGGFMFLEAIGSLDLGDVLFYELDRLGYLLS